MQVTAVLLCLQATLSQYSPQVQYCNINMFEADFLKQKNVLSIHRASFALSIYTKVLFTHTLSTQVRYKKANLKRTLFLCHP